MAAFVSRDPIAVPGSGPFPVVDGEAEAQRGVRNLSGVTQQAMPGLGGETKADGTGSDVVSLLRRAPSMCEREMQTAVQ